MHDHIMIIGGTGMLKAASVVLAKKCFLLTSIASTERSLSELDSSIRSLNVRHCPLVLDWNDSDFADSVTAHLRTVGDPSLVVAWLHTESLGPQLAQTLSLKNEQSCDFFQIMGSAAADPLKSSESETCPIPENIAFHKIVLGFIIENGRSRWLTNNEICNGVISAIAVKEETAIVGLVTPWSARP